VFIQKWKEAGVEILTGVPIPARLGRRAGGSCAQQGFKPKIASIGKAILFPAAVEALRRRPSPRGCRPRSGGARRTRSSRR